ncbi:MAG: DUF4190 domain-containing protein [Myxococcaceae bacterium]
MHCETCDGALTPGRLFCPGCGAVSPEGMAVMTAGGEGPSGLAVAVPMGAPVRMAHRAVPTSPTAVVSLVFGILSYVAIPVVGALIAVVTGHAARREIRVSGGRVDGQLLASLGLALGYSQIALAGLLFLVVFGLGALAIVHGG